MVKICLVTIYKQPDYIRAKTLRTAFSSIPGVELIVVKNTNTGMLRYIEVFIKLISVRINHHPDIYFQTFRAYESFPFTRLITIGKPFIFDEFINPIEQIAYENHRINPHGLIAKIAKTGYKIWLNTVTLMVTDTNSHADYSSELMHIPRSKYVPLIVSTDEKTFNINTIPVAAKDHIFTIFYYGNMLPLHGLPTVLSAMELIKDKEIQLILVGGKENAQQDVAKAIAKGAKVIYEKWVAFEDLPNYVQSADLCLGGPYGGTIQSQFVITGKAYQFIESGKATVIGINKETDIFTDKINALLVEQANPRALADTFLWAYEHQGELATIGLAGHDLYREKLSNKVLVSQLKSLLTNKRLL